MEGPYRSRREADIAGMFKRYCLSFRHEYPLAVLDRGQMRCWYPDFLLPEQGVIVEYNGMPANPECSARAEHKKRVYAELGLPALLLEPEDFKGYWPERVLSWLEAVQQKRMGQLNNARGPGSRAF